MPTEPIVKHGLSGDSSSSNASTRIALCVRQEKERRGAILEEDSSQRYCASVGLGRDRQYVLWDLEAGKRSGTKPGKRAEINPLDAFINNETKMKMRSLVLGSRKREMFLKVGDVGWPGITIGRRKNRNPKMYLIDQVAELDRTLLQAWELVPNFRIAEDIKRLPATLKQIVEASGAAIMSVYDSNNGAIGGSGIRAPISKEERARRKARETMMKKAKDKRKSDSRKEVLEFLKK